MRWTEERPPKESLTTRRCEERRDNFACVRAEGHDGEHAAVRVTTDEDVRRERWARW